MQGKERGKYISAAGLLYIPSATRCPATRQQKLCVDGDFPVQTHEENGGEALELDSILQPINMLGMPQQRHRDEREVYFGLLNEITVLGECILI